MNNYFKAIDRDKWIRNPQWPAFIEATNTVEIVYAVFENERNKFDIDLPATHTIDWGDGTIETVSIYEHTYDYTTLSAPILTYDDGRNYKPVKVVITLNVIEFFSRLNISPTSDANCLDCVVNVASVFPTTEYRLSVGRENIFQERFKTNNRYSNTTTSDRFRGMGRLRVFDVPDNFFENTSSLLRTFFNTGDRLKLGNINHTTSDTSFYTTTFQYSNIIEVGNISHNFVTGNQNFRYSSIKKVGNYNCPNQTSFAFEFQFSNLEEIGLITSTNVTTVSNMFADCKVKDIEFTDASAITTTTNFLNNTQSVKTLIMPGLTVGISVNGNSMEEAALDAFMTSVGTASGSQTLDLRNNPGSATCDPTIATAKGFTVLT